jgi:serine/threonine protein kinase/Tfp pilus assembly protein PilF
MSMRESVARYRIVKTLGRGSMGLVYLAEDPLLNRRVAIKVVDFADDGTQRDFQHERLLRDAKAVANLSHPNIVNVHDVVEEAGAAFIVMEYIEGSNLAEYLQKLPLPALGVTVQVLRQMASALDYAHGKGVVHRDIKPGNVMLGPGGVAKIVDFGIARMNDTRTSTPTGFMVGTAAYMPPEQFTASPLDGRADQYSLAAVGYEMLAGGTVFGDHVLPVLAYKAVNEMPEPVSERNPGLPASVDTALNKALAKSPADRYKTCAEFIETLAGSLSGTSFSAAVPLSAPVYTSPPPSLPGVPPAMAPSFMPAPVAPSAQPFARGTLRDTNSPSTQMVMRRSSTGIYWAAGIGALVLTGGGLAIWNHWLPASQTAAVPIAEPAVKPSGQPKKQPKATSVAQAKPPAEREPAADPPVTPPVKAPVNPVVETPPPATKAEVHDQAPPKTPVVPPERAPVTRPPADEATARAPVNDPPPEPETAPEDPTDTAAYRHGMEQMKAHDYQAAVQSFTSAIAQRPNHFGSYYSRGQSHQMLMEIDEAVKDYTQAIRIRARSPMAYAERGGCYVRLHRDDAALDDFNKALELRPNIVIALTGRSGIFVRRRQFDKAVNDATEALRLNPHAAQAYRNRAAAKDGMGDRAGAKADRMAADMEKVSDK